MSRDLAMVSVRDALPGRVPKAVRAALEALPWRDALGGSERVLVKPNLGYDIAAPGATTSSEVLEAVCRFFVEEGLQVTIIEADQVLVDVERAAHLAGIPEMCIRLGLRWRNLSEHPFRRRSLEGAHVFHQIDLPAILDEAPLVNVPVLKTHAKTVMSGAVKNLWGLLPTDRHRYHPVLDLALQDLYSLVPTALTVMDATVAMEGNGPKTGTPRRVDSVFASTDGIAVDQVAAHVMGISVEEVAHLAALAKDKVAFPLIDGALPTCVPFRRPKHNPVSWLENRLRGSVLEKVVFDTPVFDLCCAGARTWYRLRQGSVNRSGTS